jgi:hypothetical protein
VLARNACFTSVLVWTTAPSRLRGRTVGVSVAYWTAPPAAFTNGRFYKPWYISDDHGDYAVGTPGGERRAASIRTLLSSPGSNPRIVQTSIFRLLPALSPSTLLLIAPEAVKAVIFLTSVDSSCYLYKIN